MFILHLPFITYNTCRYSICKKIFLPKYIIFSICTIVDVILSYIVTNKIQLLLIHFVIDFICNCLRNRIIQSLGQIQSYLFSILEIKTCGLGPRIQDVEVFWYKTEIKIIYFVPLCLIVLIVSDCIRYNQKTTKVQKELIFF